MPEIKIRPVDRSHREAFERGLQQGTLNVPEETKAAFPGILNEDILEIFEAGDVMPMREIAIGAYRIFQRQLPWPNGRDMGLPQGIATWEDAGSIIRFAMQHGLVTEEPGGKGGQRRWRLVSRERKWILKGTRAARQAVQVRGLPPEEQAIQDRREATAAKVSRTWDRKAREAETPRIERSLDNILRKWPDALVNEQLVGNKGVDPAYEGRRIDEMRTVLAEHHLHRGFDREELAEWAVRLYLYKPWPRHWREVAIGRGPFVGVPPDEEASVEAPPADIPAADAAALGWL